jgi:hypothetical protein
MLTMSDVLCCTVCAAPCLCCSVQELEADVVALMAKRVYDVAGVLNKGCKVTTPALFHTA